MRPVPLVVLLLSTIVGSGSAQIPNLPTLGPSWTDVSYPKLFYTSRDGFTAGLYYAQMRPMGFADFEEPEPYWAILSLDGQISTAGRRELTVEGRLPKLVRGWRFVLTLNGERRPRERYFGLGNNTGFSDDSLTDAQPRFFDADGKRLFVRGEVQRRIVGGLRALAGFHIERWSLDPPDVGPSVLARDAAAGVDPTLGGNVDDTYFRFGLLFDTRDDQVAPHRGVLLEGIVGIADSSVLGDLSYTRGTLSVAGWLPARDDLVLSGRILGQGTGGSPGVRSMTLIEASERPDRGLGGASTHRALFDERFIGEDVLLANFDVRYHLLRFPTLIEFSLVGFLDAGRVFHPADGENFRLTFDDLHVGAGAGVFMRWRRTGILGLTVGVAGDGAVAQVHTSWTY